jgi:hypothetical protein
MGAYRLGRLKIQFRIMVQHAYIFKYCRGDRAKAIILLDGGRKAVKGFFGSALAVAAQQKARLRRSWSRFTCSDSEERSSNHETWNSSIHVHGWLNRRFSVILRAIAGRCFAALSELE